MKGLNTARILGLAGLTMTLAASVVAAGTVYSPQLPNDPIITANGQPAAKIVVGSTGQISDGIAASNIAAALAQYTYEQKKVTTLVTGLDGVSCTTGAGAGGSSAGTCEISNKKVTIDITVPGQLANAHQFKTLVTDAIDKQTANRQNNLSEDNYTADSTISDTSQILSPLRKAYENSQTGRNLYRIGENEFNLFSNDYNTPVKDEQASSDFSYTAQQGFWVGSGAVSSSNGVYYDSNSAYRQVVARPQIIAYNVRFMGNDYGIPACTATNTSGYWAGTTAGTIACKSDTDKTARHRVAIPFLGQKWVISDMVNPTAALNSSSAVLNGGRVKLAKEADYRIISIGEQIDAGTFKVRLADISVAVGAENTHPAILDVLDANDQVIGQIQVTPGDTYTYTQSSTGNSIKVHVYQTAGGLTLSAKWAEIAIYTDEITLEDSKRYNNAASDDTNWRNVYVSLLWKNRDGGGADIIADSLREIVLYVDDLSNYMGGENRMKLSDSIVFPKKDSVYRLTYNGLDLADADYVGLTIRSDSSRTLSYGTGVTSGTPTFDCNTKNDSYTATFIKISSDKDAAFGGTSADLLNNDRASEVYLDPRGPAGVAVVSGTNVLSAANLSGGQRGASGTYYAPMVFYKPSGCAYYKYAFFTSNLSFSTMGNDTQLLAINTSYTNSIKFDAAGDDSSAPGKLAFDFATNYTGNGFDYNITTFGIYPTGVPTSGYHIIGEIVLQEDAGKFATNSHQGVLTRVPIYNMTSNDWQFKTADSATAVTYYNGINLTNAPGTSAISRATAYELPLYTERGTKVSGVSLTDTTLKVASRIGQPQFTFSAASVAAGSENTESWTASEGDTKTLSNGVVLKVASITQTVGSCTASVAAGGAPACTVTGTNGVSAVADPANALSPYTGSLNMVVKDTDPDAKTAGAVRISVGGPLVNSLTLDAMKTSELDATYFATQSTLVRAFGKTIVVAGQYDKDTLAAADAFIAGLQQS